VRCTIESLTFDLAGDICLAAQDGILEPNDLPVSRAGELGPLLELRHVRPDLLMHQGWLATGTYSKLIINLARSTTQWYESELGLQGFIAAEKLHNDFLAWPDFAIRAKRAAKAAGFSDDYAAKITAAIGEFYSNIIEHSQVSESGYIVFCSGNRTFEFVVADSGIGVLSSLRDNPKFANLGDSGTALEVALSDGGTRHSEPGRGNGFRPLFVGLANISRFIRFRSDDHSREIYRSAGGEIVSLTRQVSNLRGFFCSVLCEAEPA